MSTFNAGAIEANLTLGRSSWTRDLKKTKAEIEDLERRSITIGVDLDTDNAQVAMDNLELFLDDLDSKNYEPTVSLGIADAEETLARFEERLDELDRRTVVIAADADTDNALIALDNLEAQMDVLENDGITIMADADIDKAVEQLAILEEFVVDIDANDININADVDTAKAEAQLAILEGMIESMDGETIDINADVDKGLSALVMGGSGGGGSMGLLKILIVAIIGLLPVLSVAMGAATAAIVAFAAALAGAIGPAAVLAGGLIILAKNASDLENATGPAGDAARGFSDSLQGLKDAIDSIVPDIAVEGFGLMSDAMDLLADIIPTLVPLFNETAGMIREVLASIGDFVGSPEYQEMLDFFGGFGVDMLHTFLNIGGNLIVFFGRLFDAISPFASRMMSGLEEMTAGWAEWADNLDSNPAFQHFIDNALEYGPMVLDMLGSMLAAFIAIGHALEPFAGPMLIGLTAFFDAIANAPTWVLSALIGGFAALLVTFQVIVPLFSAVAGAFTAVAGGVEALTLALGIGLGPLVLIVAAIAGLAAIIVHLWKTNETFRNSVIETWNAIKEAIAPIVNDVVGLIKENWGPIKQWAKDVFGDIEEIVVSAMVIIRQIVRAVTAVVKAIWRTFGSDILAQGKTVFKTLASVIRGAFQIIKGIFQIFRGILTGDFTMFWEGIKNVARGAVGIVSGIFRGMFNTFKNIVTAIGHQITSLVGFFRALPGKVSSAVTGLWDGIGNNFKQVINDIIGWWNNLSFSVDIPNKIPGLPDSFTVSTPNVPTLAEGAYLTEATLAVAGEAGPEIVAPEPKLREIVRENSGANLDYGMLARALAIALGDVLRNIQFRIAPEDLQAILDRAGAHVAIDAGTDPNEAVRRMTSALSFELRRLGFGGKANV